MFSIRQNTFQRSTRLPKKSQLLTMDVIYKGQPFVEVVATNSDALSLDIIKQAQPFIPAFDNTKKSSQLILSGNNHPDVQLWLNNVQANGGSASAGTITALNTFCNSIDSAGLRSKFYRLNLFCGDNLNSALVPIYLSTNWLSPSYGFGKDINYNFVSGDYSETGSNAGLTSSGADPTQQNVGTKYLDTGFSPSMVGAIGSLIDNLHIAATVSTTAISAAGQTIVYSTSSYVDVWILSIQLLSGYANVRSTITQNGINAQLSPLSTGLVSPATHLINSRLTTTDSRVYQGGSQIGSTNTTPVTATLTRFTPTFLLFRQSAGYYSNLRLSDYSLGQGLTISEASSYNSILQTFKNSLNRT
jgi:hypothetical protein